MLRRVYCLLCDLFFYFLKEKKLEEAEDEEKEGRCIVGNKMGSFIFENKNIENSIFSNHSKTDRGVVRWGVVEK